MDKLREVVAISIVALYRRKIACKVQNKLQKALTALSIVSFDFDFSSKKMHEKGVNMCQSLSSMHRFGR